MKIALVGLGQVGTSVGLALRAVSDAFEIVGHDPDDERVKRARKLKAVDSTHWNLISACEGAELVVIDQPMQETCSTLEALESGLEGEEPPVVIDTCRVKRPVMQAARGRTSYVFVGGDPVSACMLSVGEPSAELFQSGVFYLVAGIDTPPEALNRCNNLSQALGATPRFCDAAEHDGLMAAMTQMPAMANLAILNALGQTAGQQDRADSVGALLAALGPIPTVDDVSGWQANRDNVVRWLAQVGQAIGALQRTLESDDGDALREQVEQAEAQLASWQSKGDDSDALDNQPGMLRSMFLGGLGQKRR